MKKAILIICLIFFYNSSAQDVSCDDYMDFIKTKGYSSTSLSNYTLDTSWLYKVTKYTYEYNNYVIVEIKENEYSYTTKKYIYCGISNTHWSGFRYGGYGDTESFGKRFLKYIAPY